jgi:NAD(P)-dependent dehydrogenase (short-subunit alcohol dehydrogenase family)
MTMEHFKDRVAVVTGAASGIGFALAKRLCAEEMCVVLADVEQSALSRAAAELESSGHRVAAVRTDVSDRTSVDALAQYVAETYGPVDLLCNNAGVGGTFGMSWDLPDRIWDWVIGVNLWGVVHGIQAFVPSMVERNCGHILNTASVGGLLALPASAPYSATKFAIVGISEALAEELKMRGSTVGVSVLCPGEVRTAIADDLRNWPDRFGPPPSPSPDANLVELAAEVRAAIDAGMEPDRVVDQVIDGVRRNRFWICPHASEHREAILERAQAIVASE